MELPVRQLVMTAVAVGLATGVAVPLGLDRVAVLGGLVAVLTLVGASVGPLRADLRAMVWLGPLLTAVVAVGPSLEGPPAIVVASLVVLGAGMLPALGSGYLRVGQVMATTTLLALTTGLGEGQDPVFLAAGGACGVLLAVVVRIAAGKDDPSGPTRAAVAAALTDQTPGGLHDAARVWRADGTRAWLGEVLAGAAEYRAGRAMLLAGAARSTGVEARRLRTIASDAELVAGELAAAVTAPACTGLPAMAKLDPAAKVLAERGAELPPAVGMVRSGLDRVRRAVVDRKPDRLARPSWRGVLLRALGVLTAHLSFRSSLFRHSLRCALAVAGGMFITLWLDTPSAAPMLLVLYLVLQPITRDTMEGGLQRTGASVVGVALAAGLVALLPWPWVLIPVALFAMIAGVSVLRTSFPLLMSGVVAVVLLVQVPATERPVAAVLVSFGAITAVGATLALILGYASYLVLPSSSLPNVGRTTRMAALAVGELTRGAYGARDTSEGRRALRGAYVRSLRRTQDLLGLPARLEEAGPSAEEAARRAGAALDALRAAVGGVAFRPQEVRERLTPVLRLADEELSEVGRRAPREERPDLAGIELLAGPVVEGAYLSRLAVDELVELGRELSEDAEQEATPDAAFEHAFRYRSW
ncbi:FUSC family protein [Actinoalloteichus caeruleus]|uniref:FUSC family protein n=1 Tax=Actinoalloteichus cyanogriseus TaxID=2893586 RepID=UPI00068B2D71|nr:FUSC family protein [Actinoalloteichus caeruleus]